MSVGAATVLPMYDTTEMLQPGPRRLPARRPPATVANVSIQARPTGPGRRHPQPCRRPLTAAEQWWRYSRRCAAALRAGVPPAPVDVYGPVLHPGEHAVLTTEASYARYCGTPAHFSPLPLLVAGRPAVMFGALAVQGIVNHRRKQNAQRQAAQRWRWHQSAPVIVTTDRLLCHTTPHGLVSLWYGDCTQFHPDLQQWTLTLAFDSTPPVRLSGPAAPALSLWSGYGVLGDSWVNDPRLAPLLA